MERVGSISKIKPMRYSDHDGINNMVARISDVILPGS